MSDNNEIDDIIKEIRNKNDQLDRQDKYEDFDTKAPIETENPIDETITFTIEKDADVEASPEPPEEIQLDATSEEPKIENKANQDIIDILDSFSPEYPEQDNEDYYEEEYEDTKKKKKKIAIIAVAVVLVIAVIAAVAAFALKGSNEEPSTTTKSTTTTTTTAAPVVVRNPLTGEAGYNKAAVNVRPVACVVENSYYARPQWGIDSDKHTPDIILEGEVEGGETRMLWFYADYTSIPQQIGPMRSARPPFIKFSQLFDSIFIHWGQSSSRGDYVGADTVFKQGNIDHINQMRTSGVDYLFGRDSSRSRYGTEHTGVLYGEKVAQAIKACGFRTQADNSRYTKLSFNKKEQKLGTTACDTLGLTFSNRSNTRDWTYDAKDKLYHSSDYSNSNIAFSDVTRKNLLVLFDGTQYVAKQNYKGSGRAEIYCNYNLAGGKGKLASMGTVIDIVWSVENGKLVIKDTNGKAVKLNVGTTWIGWGSSNNGGSVKIGSNTDTSKPNN